MGIKEHNEQCTTIIRMIERLDKRIARIERILGQKINQKTWVKASVIKELTGWEGSKMQWARNNHLLEFRKTDGTVEYLMESIRKEFLLSRSETSIVTL